MSYPPPVYHGDSGEVAARFRPVSTPAELPRPTGAAHYLATGATTDGRFGLYRWDMGPGSGEPASLLILFAPGAPREAYFEGLVEIAEGRWQPTHEEMEAFLVEHDNIYVE